MFGLGLGKLGSVIGQAVAAAFSPANLFASGEQGAWYDPSDLSTMFQGAVSTTPVTAPGQPVGLILDKSKAPTSRTALPVMTCSATVSQAGNVLTFASSPAGDQASGNPPINGNYFYRMSFTIVGTGSVVIYVGASPVTFSAGTHTLKSWNANAASYFIFRANAGGFNGTVTFTELLEYAGNHASQDTTAKKPLLQNDGVNNYLYFDGVDDSLSTAAIDFTAINKIGIFAGINNTGAGWKVALMFSSGGFDAGSFGLQAPTNDQNGSTVIYPSGEAAFKIQGWTDTTNGSNYVLTANTDNATATRNIVNRINAVENSALNTGVLSGNFGTFPINIASNGIGGENFAGRIYSLIILGRLATTQEITDTETWINSKIGAF